jgi:hypothetical protein
MVFDPSFIGAMPFKQGIGILLGLQHLRAKISLDIEMRNRWSSNTSKQSTLITLT